MDAATTQQGWGAQMEALHQDNFNLEVSNLLSTGMPLADAQQQPQYKEAERRLNAAKKFRAWIPTLDDNNISYIPELAESWNSKISYKQGVTTLESAFYRVAEHFVMDRKIREFDNSMPRQVFIDAIINIIKESRKNRDANCETEGTVAFYPEPHKQASFKHDSLHNFDFADGDFSTTVEKDGRAQMCGSLYRTMDKGGKEYKAFQQLYTNNWTGERHQAPVTAIECIYTYFVNAHVESITDKSGQTTIRHNGRDTTYNNLKKGWSSEIPKGLVGKLIEDCPSCRPRVKASKEAAKIAEPKRQEKRAAKLASRDSPDSEEDSAYQRATKKQRTMLVTPNNLDSLPEVQYTATNQQGQSSTHVYNKPELEVPEPDGHLNQNSLVQFNSENWHGPTDLDIGSLQAAGDYQDDLNKIEEVLGGPCGFRLRTVVEGPSRTTTTQYFRKPSFDFGNFNEYERAQFPEQFAATSATSPADPIIYNNVDPAISNDNMAPVSNLPEYAEQFQMGFSYNTQYLHAF